MKKQQANQIIQSLLGRDTLPKLHPTSIWSGELEGSIDDLFAAFKDQTGHIHLVLAGLYLLNDSHDKSHVILQEIKNDLGSCLHSIIHRMEPDYSNARYWSAQFNHRGMVPSLQEEIRSVLSNDVISGTVDNKRLNSILMQINRQDEWNPTLLIDAVECYETDGTLDNKLEQSLIDIQWAELKALFKEILHEAGGAVFESK